MPNDANRIRILLIEDSETDAELIELGLIRAELPVVVERVDSLMGIKEAFRNGCFDAVVCDYFLPSATAPEILGLYRRAGWDAPFIICSGTLTDEEAVALLKTGASDFFRKEAIGRLGGAIRRELEEAERRRAFREAEAKLAQSEELLRQVVEASPNGIVLVDEAGRMLLVNHAVERLFGYSRQELLNQSVEMLVPGAAQAVHSDFRAEYAAAPEARPMGKGDALFGERKGGESFPIEIGLAPFGSSSGTRIVATIVDLSHRLAIEERLRQAQKMEAIGRLAGGVAHDFNNILTAISGFGQLAREEVPADHPVQDSLQEILRAAGRAADLTRQMLAFSRQQVLQPRVVSLSDIIEECCRMLARVAREDVTLVLRLDPALRTVLADPVQIEQVLLNLVANARDAMPEGGQVTIETANVDIDEDYAKALPSGRAGRFVMFSVSDTGLGMDEATAARVFEPFFTTKALGSGTGLGLATVYGIVKQSSGFIWVYSELGHGTRFKVYLPAVEAEDDVEAVADVSDVLTEVKATVLVVEDQEAVRKAVSRQLEKLGHRVLAAGGGEEALRVSSAEPGEIDLLLTDVLMPGMGGPEVASRLRATRPQLRVLLMSGYSNGEVTSRRLEEEGFAHLEKPFSASALRLAVQRALARDV